MSVSRIAAAAVLAGSAGVGAQVCAPPVNVVSLSASATVEVPTDLLTVTFSTRSEGTDATLVQGQLKQAVDAALAEARRAARPGQVDVRSGNFSLYPRYAPKGGINGWQGTAEVIVSGRDIAGIAALTGQVQTMTIAGIAFSLSREARTKVEAEVTAEAISRFRAKADEVSRQFGFGGYTIGEVSVATDESGPINRPMLRAKTQSMVAEAALPVEAGKADVTASVSGSVTMSQIK